MLSALCLSIGCGSGKSDPAFGESSAATGNGGAASSNASSGTGARSVETSTSSTVSNSAGGGVSTSASSAGGSATTSSGGMSSGGASGGASGSGGSGGATLDGDTIKSCETYCMTDADCCAEFGFGDECPDRYPGRVLCHDDPELGWDHVCRRITGGCVDDAECQGEDPELICVEDAPQWCSPSLCPGLNTCMSPGCAEDSDCGSGSICIVRGRVGLCAKACETQADCDPIEQCQDNVYVEDPRPVCIQQPNTFPPVTDPPPPECATDADCADSGNGPRCHATLGRCGCADDSDCSDSERCR